MVFDKMMTEDIIQNVYLKFFENMNQLRNKEFATTWLYSTARNEVFDHLRKKKTRKTEIISDEEEDVVSPLDVDIEYERIELRSLIMKELDKLPEEQREVYLLKEYSGLKYEEIASIQKIDVELVKSRLFKTRQKLIKRISKLV